MSVTNATPQSLKLDIKDFIQLLQKNQPQLPSQAAEQVVLQSCINLNPRRRLSVDSGKLSIIYSASQPESSLIDKQNSHNSANKCRSGEQHDQIDTIIKEIKKLGLSTQQNKYMEKLESVVNELRKCFYLFENRCKVVQGQYEEEKKGTDEILKALVRMDEAEKEIWSNYSELSNKYLELEQKHNKIKQQNQSLVNQLSQAQKDIQFMKKLVLIANQNYQTIEQKCRSLQQMSKTFQNYKQQRSSPQITSRSTILQKKSSCSPSISDRSNMSARKSSFEENYRKLVLRTLKSKAFR